MQRKLRHNLRRWRKLRRRRYLRRKLRHKLRHNLRWRRNLRRRRWRKLRRRRYLPRNLRRNLRRRRWRKLRRRRKLRHILRLQYYCITVVYNLLMSFQIICSGECLSFYSNTRVSRILLFVLSHVQLCVSSGGSGCYGNRRESVLSFPLPL